jgi:hypothetical protein
VLSPPPLLQKVSRVTASSAHSSRKNASDDEVENDEGDDDVEDSWSGRHQSREVRVCLCSPYG